MPTKAQARFNWDKVNGTGERHIVEFAAAIVQTDPLLAEPMLKAVFLNDSLQLFLNSSAAKVGSGDVASNLRYKKDKDRNQAVVKNTITLLEFYRKFNKNPVVITSYPREQRRYSFKMNEGGNMDVINSISGEREVEKESILKGFFKSMGMNLNRFQKMRMSSEGARFYTYLADLLSFITQVDYYYHPEMFEEVFLSPDVVNTETKDEEGKQRLTKVDLSNGRSWEPKEGFDYLYFTEKKSEMGQSYIVPKEGVIEKVSNQLWELLSQGDNGTKKMVRDHFLNVKMFHRWSDYSVNDVDDGITLMAIVFAFQFGSTKEEEKIKVQLSETLGKWYHDLNQE